jgi:glycosyltransferase involved in cell wall biosynthesis
MHVLYLHQYFVPPDGSGGTRSFEMSRRLVKAGHRVTLVTSSAFFPARYVLGPGVTTLDFEGVEVRVIRVPYSNKLSYARRVLAFLDFAWRSLREASAVKGVDLVFATSTPLTIALPGLWAKRFHRAPLVFEVRDLWPELPVAIGALRNPALIAAARALERAAYRGAKRVVALSPGMRDGVLRTGLRGPAEVAVVPNSCDVELFRAPATAGTDFLDRHPQLRGGPLVSYTGTLGPINGVEYLADVAKAMLALDPSVRFVVTGDGRCRDAVLAGRVRTACWSATSGCCHLCPRARSPLCSRRARWPPRCSSIFRRCGIIRPTSSSTRSRRAGRS